MAVNKKLLQVFSALLILVYHVWMPVGSGTVSQFIIRTGYIGVDIFFFLAAYSLADKQIKYLDFIRDRFGKIYLKFLLFTIVAALYKGWTFGRVIRILLFAELFERGGGSFLWFIPAIMIFYLLYPLYLKLNEKTRVWYVLAGWLAFSLISQHLLDYTTIFIFTNRIPAMLAGSVCKTIDLPENMPKRSEALVRNAKNSDAEDMRLKNGSVSAANAVCAAMIPIGLVLLYFFGFKTRLNVPVKDMYFVAGLPLIIGLAWLSGLTAPAGRGGVKIQQGSAPGSGMEHTDAVRGMKRKGGFANRIINLLGNCTLELYALQVIFGTVVARAVYNLIGLKLAANLVTVAVIWLAAILVEKCWSLAQRKIGAGAN